MSCETTTLPFITSELLSSLTVMEQSNAKTLQMIHPAKLAGILITAGHWVRQHCTCVSWIIIHRWQRWRAHCWKFILLWHWISMKVMNFMVRKWKPYHPITSLWTGLRAELNLGRNITIWKPGAINLYYQPLFRKGARSPSREGT